jgi:hypothetical protein
MKLEIYKENDMQRLANKRFKVLDIEEFDD